MDVQLTKTVSNNFSDLKKLPESLEDLFSLDNGGFSFRLPETLTHSDSEKSKYEKKGYRGSEAKGTQSMRLTHPKTSVKVLRLH